MADVGTALFREITHLKKRKLLLRIALTGRVSVRGQKDDWCLHYQWLKKDPAYAAAYQQAREIAGDRLEEEAFRRALSISDTMLIFLLKGYKPERYRERIDTTGTVNVVLSLKYADPPPEDRPCVPPAS